MIDLNVRALTDLSLRFTRQHQRHRGGILNVASVAGFLPGPGMAVYYASKAYVVSFTEALQQELDADGVASARFARGRSRPNSRRGPAPDTVISPPP